MQEYENEEQEHHEGSWLISWGLPIVYVGLVFAFGIQTWELVAHLFPAENLFMQIATVFSFDVMAAIWLGVKTFGRFRLYSSLSLVRWMFRITFTLATIASVIQMYLNAVHFLYQSVDHNIILFAYALVVISFAGNLIALSYLLSSEHDAKNPKKIIGSGYMPKQVKRPPPPHQQPSLPAPQPVTGQLSQVAQVKRTCDACGKGGPGGLDGSVWLCQECLDRTLTSRAAHIAAIRESAQSETKPDTAMDEWFNLYKKSGESGIMSFPAFMKKMRDATNPLPKSPLDSQASHEGNQNGKQ